MSLPKEIVMDLPVVTLVGRGEITIENYKSLLEFGEAVIRVRTREGDIRIEGEHLALELITTETLLVTGRMACIVYE